MAKIKQISINNTVYDIEDASAQPALVSGTNIKTVNGVSVVGSGDVSTTLVATVTESNGAYASDKLFSELNAAFNAGISVYASYMGVRVPMVASSVNTHTALFYGTLDGDAANITIGSMADQVYVTITSKQDTLVPGTSIKNINGASLLDAGNIDVALKDETLPNKTYAPSEFSGLGRKYLQKNIVSNKNMLTQAMLQDGSGNALTNTIFVVQYDYDLNGQSVTLPSGCTLQFDGGSISNGTIVGQGSVIRADKKAISTDVTFSGTFSGLFRLSYVDWDSSCTSDNYDTLKSIYACYQGHQNDIVWDIAELHILCGATSIMLDDGVVHDFNNTNIIIKGNTSGYHWLFDISNTFTEVSGATSIASVISSQDFAGKIGLIKITDNTPFAERLGYTYSYNREDIIVVVNGEQTNDPILPYDDGESDPSFSVAFPNGNGVVKNLVFVRNIESSSDKTAEVGVLKVTGAYGIVIDNVNCMTNIASGVTGLSGDSLIHIFDSAGVRVSNFNILGTSSSSDSYGYGLELRAIYDICLNSIASRNNWDWMGSRNINKLELHNCTVDNVDCHIYSKDFYVAGCTLFMRSSSITTHYGYFKYENCKFRDYNLITHDSSVPLFTFFTLVVNDCEFHGTANRLFSAIADGVPSNSRSFFNTTYFPDIVLDNVVSESALYVKLSGTQGQDVFTLMPELSRNTWNIAVKNCKCGILMTSNTGYNLDYTELYDYMKLLYENATPLFYSNSVGGNLALCAETNYIGCFISEDTISKIYNYTTKNTYFFECSISLPQIAYSVNPKYVKTKGTITCENCKLYVSTTATISSSNKLSLGLSGYLYPNFIGDNDFYINITSDLDITGVTIWVFSLPGYWLDWLPAGLKFHLSGKYSSLIQRHQTLQDALDMRLITHYSTKGGTGNYTVVRVPAQNTFKDDATMNSALAVLTDTYINVDEETPNIVVLTSTTSNYITLYKQTTGIDGRVSTYRLLQFSGSSRLTMGTTEQRPTLGSPCRLVYLDTSLMRQILWDGSKWLSFDGAQADVPRSGTYANRPSSSGIYIGFQYFCTDKQTTEGATDGIVIYHKGNGVWVDALGRVVS